MNPIPLKAWCALLPHEVRVQSPRRIESSLGEPMSRMIGTLSGAYVNNSCPIALDLDDYGEIDFKAKDCKPILYPVEFLTKGIEHNGKHVVPIFKIRETGFRIGDLATHGMAEYLKKDFKKFANVEVYDLCLSLHINVLGLTPEQYIDKSKL